jgi:hypothetical protein
VKKEQRVGEGDTQACCGKRDFIADWREVCVCASVVV